MPKTRKSWQEKLADDKGLPKVVEITDKMSKRWGTGTVVIPAPKEVDEIMKKFPEVNLLPQVEFVSSLLRNTVLALVAR
jgi:hypothetical protein